MSFRTIDCPTAGSIRDSLTEVGEDLVNRVIPQQRESGKSWQIIRFELWEDSGRIIAFPACEPLIVRTDVTGVQIVCSEVSDRVDALDDSDLDDETYEKKIHQIVARLSADIFDAYQCETRFSYKVFTQDGYELAKP